MFLELTTLKDENILINSDQILFFGSEKGKTYLVLVDGFSVNVTQTYSQILAYLGKMGKMGKTS